MNHRIRPLNNTVQRFAGVRISTDSAFFFLFLNHRYQKKATVSQTQLISYHLVENGGYFTTTRFRGVER